ncbi:hypothetical protein C8J56DRAFT_209512 [Mycena floridula]|nr:hypothetical protein C8J56DRAFT_209512 [Mycena floridula]
MDSEQYSCFWRRSSEGHYRWTTKCRIYHASSSIPDFIFQSGFVASTFTHKGDRREKEWHSFVSAVPECGDLGGTNQTFSCLRKVKSSQSFLRAFGIITGKAQEAFPWVPALDGPNGVFPDFPSQIFDQGGYSKLPFIAGTTVDEVDYTTENIRKLVTSYYTPPIAF